MTKPRPKPKPEAEPQAEPQIADVWTTTTSDFKFGSPEIELLARRDLFDDGDWHEAILATIVAIENNLMVPDWAKTDAVTELKRSIDLKCARRKSGRHARGHGDADYMNWLSIVAAVDAAADCGSKGSEKFERAWRVLNAEGVSVARSSVETLFKKHRQRMRSENHYCVIRDLFWKELTQARGTQGK